MTSITSMSQCDEVRLNPASVKAKILGTVSPREVALSRGVKSPCNLSSRYHPSNRYLKHTITISAKTPNAAIAAQEENKTQYAWKLGSLSGVSIKKVWLTSR